MTPHEPPSHVSRTRASRSGVLTYFVLTFAISWGGVVAVVGVRGFPGSEADFQALLPMVVVAMLAGPSVSGLATTVLVLGRIGLRDLGRRSLHWRVGVWWYAFALLTAPLIVGGTLTMLSIADPVFRPGIFTTNEPATHVLLGILTGIAAGLFEEVGWTGFAIPRLRLRHGVWATGLIVGMAWGAWHLLVTWWGSSATSGSLPMAVYLPAMTLSFLPPYRILMVWVYDRTDSLFVAMLMHASLTASVRVFDPVPVSGVPIVAYNLALAAALWCVVGALAVTPRALRCSPG